jgi:hypothetical protein
MKYHHPGPPFFLPLYSEKFIDDTFDSTPFTDSSWFSDSPVIGQREDHSSFPSSLQREEATSVFQQTSNLPPPSSESEHPSLQID